METLLFCLQIVEAHSPDLKIKTKLHNKKQNLICDISFEKLNCKDIQLAENEIYRLSIRIFSSRDELFK